MTLKEWVTELRCLFQRRRICDFDGGIGTRPHRTQNRVSDTELAWTGQRQWWRGIALHAIYASWSREDCF
jgi:hypothetical protein